MIHPKPWTSKPTNAGIGLFDANGENICWEWDIDQETCDHILACVNTQPELLKTLEKIANHPHNSYDVVKNSQYNIGVVDGHRCAAKIAKATQ